MPTSTANYKEIWRLSQPIILGSAIESIINITDTAFLGRVSDVALGAVALGGIFYLAFIMLGFGFGIGNQIIIARRFGENNFEQIGKTIFHAAIFLMPMALLVLLTTHFGSEQFFGSFVKSPHIHAAVVDFVNIRMFGIFFSFTNILFRAFYVGTLNTRVIGWGSALVAVSNAILGYIFIFGHFGLPVMGIKGAALAAVIAEALGTVYYFSFFIRKIDRAQFGFLSRFTFDPQLLKHVLAVAAPVMLQFFVSFGGWFTFFMLIEKMGEVPLAVSNIIRSIYMVLLLPLWGFASTTNSLVSYKMGSNRQNEIAAIVKKIVLMSLLIVSTLVLLCNVFANTVLHFYTNNETLIQAALPSLRVISVSALLLAVSVIIFNTVSGTGKTITSMLIEATVIVAYVLWTYFMVEVQGSSVAMVWCSEILYGVILGSLSISYLKFGKWKQGVV